MSPTTIDLSEAVNVNIKAFKGDNFGPIQFVFQESYMQNCDGECDDPNEAVYNLQDLRGAIFEGEITRGKNIVHMFTPEELTFDSVRSMLNLQMTSSTVYSLPSTVLHLSIRQILNGNISTRVYGRIIFITNE